MAMRWEKAQAGGGGDGPGVRWGHTCNAVGGGKRLYVFGGYGKDQCQTNQVHVFDTDNKLWSEPVLNGTPPIPRDSHSCTTVGDNLFIFGGTDGRRPLNDLHILLTSTNTWVLPNVRGDAPEPREGHSAALIGKRLFIFGGCGKSENSEIYYDDLYILNTETFLWKRVFPSGTPPSKRDSHTCSSWMNKIIVIGGEDSFNYYLSDVHILDADTLVWCKLNTMGQLLPPRGGHTTISLGKNLFVFGGFSNEKNLYDDVYMLDIETGTWTKVSAIGEGPSGRFSMAGESLDPQMGGLLVFIGGCNKNLEALDDMYYLHTGLSREIDRDERRNEKLSLRKQLKLKCQEQHTVTPGYEKASSGVEHENDNTIYQPMPISSFMPSGRQNFYLNDYQTPFGKKTFQAKVTKSFSDGYTIETIIDGKPLRGVLFSNKPSSISTGVDNFNRKMEAMKISNLNVHVDLNPVVESEKPQNHNATVVGQTEIVQNEKEGAQARAEIPTSETKCLATESLIPVAQAEVEIPTSETKHPATESLTPVAQAEVEIPTSETKHPATELLIPVAQAQVEIPTSETKHQATELLIPVAQGQVKIPTSEPVAQAQVEIPTSEIKHPATDLFAQAQVEISTSETKHPATESLIPAAQAQMEIPTSETKNPATEFVIPQQDPVASEPHLAPDANAGSDAAVNQLTNDAKMHEEDVSAVVRDQTVP